MKIRETYHQVSAQRALEVEIAARDVISLKKKKHVTQCMASKTVCNGTHAGFTIPGQGEKQILCMGRDIVLAYCISKEICNS